MNDALKATLAPTLRSWIESANDPASDFPIQNLPFGIFSDAVNERPRAGVAIGDWIADLSVLEAARLVPAHDVFAQPGLNAFIALGRETWRAVRVALSGLFARDTPTLRDDADLRRRALVPRKDATMHLPVAIPGYTDFTRRRNTRRTSAPCFAIRRTRCCRTGRRCRSAITGARRRWS